MTEIDRRKMVKHLLCPGARRAGIIQCLCHKTDGLAFRRGTCRVNTRQCVNHLSRRCVISNYITGVTQLSTHTANNPNGSRTSLQTNTSDSWCCYPGLQCLESRASEPSFRAADRFTSGMTPTRQYIVVVYSRKA